MAEKKQIELDAKYHGGPYTEKALGSELYARLAVESGAFNPKEHPGFRPPLDLSEFEIVAPKPTVTPKQAVTPAKPTTEAN